MKMKKEEEMEKIIAHKELVVKFMTIPLVDKSQNEKKQKIISLHSWLFTWLFPKQG